MAAELRKSSCESDVRICYVNHPKKISDEAALKQVQHGSPSELRRNYVYPATQSAPIPAFQAPPHYSPKSHHALQDLRKGSPLSVRAAAKVQDPSVVSDTEESVNKIRAMFPTVSDTHIRLLLKKYHGREVVVISALQVEKYPITTPGPFPTPPPAHLSFRGAASRVGSPKPAPGCANGSPATRNYSPRPHSSPKLKLRYMKSIFPQPDEMVILDVLTSNDNDIQKTTETLKEMGFERKDTTKIIKRKATEVEKTQRNDDVDKTSVPKVKSLEEKEKITAEMKRKYRETPAHLITIALESVNFDEKRADQILQIITQEEQEKIAEPKRPTQPKETVTEQVKAPAVPVSQSRQSLKSLLKSEKTEVHSFSRQLNEAEESGFRSSLLSNTKGANPKLSKGPNHDYLLTDYMKCQGPDLSLRKGPQGLAKGPNPSNLLGKKYRARGPNAELQKSAKVGLAKGSIFAQFKGFASGESRGK